MKGGAGNVALRKLTSTLQLNRQGVEIGGRHILDGSEQTPRPDATS